MFWKWLMTGSAVLLVFIGASLLDCTYSFLSFVDAFDVCVEADLTIPGGSVAVGVVLITGGVMLSTYQWLPYLIGLYKEKEGLEETRVALVKNVSRLKGEASGPVEKLLHHEDASVGDEGTSGDEELSVDLREEPTDIEPVAPEAASVSLLRRVELMETLLRDEEVAPGPVAKHWIELLREANELHRNGTLDTAAFIEANTRLLDLYVSPDDDPYDARRKVGSEPVG